MSGAARKERPGIPWRAEKLSGILSLAVLVGLLISSLGVAVPSHASPNPSCFGHRATIVGTEGDDQLRGTQGSDVIVGLGGRDDIAALGGNDLICSGKGGSFRGQPEILRGGPGNDRISGGPGGELVYGDDGNDHILLGIGHNVGYGGRGSDVLHGGPEEDELYGNSGNDQLYGRGWFDILTGGSHDDLLDGGKDREQGDFASFFRETRGVEVDLSKQTAAGAGNDRLINIERVFGSQHDDILIGDSSNNTFLGSSGNDILQGMGGDDCLNPGSGQNAVVGGDGFDYYNAHYGQLSTCRTEPESGAFIDGTIAGGTTIDLAAGTAESDMETSMLSEIEGAFGSPEADQFFGDSGNNFFYGAGSNDHAWGQDGDDELDGAGGSDSADGGNGTDECRAEVVMFCE